MTKKIFVLLLIALFLTACSKAPEENKEEAKQAPTTTCGNKICEVFLECPEKNCPPSEYPNTCPTDCKLSCAWSQYKNFCDPQYTDVDGNYIGLDSHLTYILENYSCETSLDCPFSHHCTDVNFNDPEITSGRICVINPLEI